MIQAQAQKVHSGSFCGTYLEDLFKQAQTVPGLKILKSNWPCLSPVPIIWNVVSATVGHTCEIAFHVMSEPLDFLMILHVQMR